MPHKKNNRVAKIPRSRFLYHHQARLSPVKKCSIENNKLEELDKHRSFGEGRHACLAAGTFDVYWVISASYWPSSHPFHRSSSMFNTAQCYLCYGSINIIILLKSLRKTGTFFWEHEYFVYSVLMLLNKVHQVLKFWIIFLEFNAFFVLLGDDILKQITRFISQ